MLIPNFGKTWMVFIFYNSIYYWARRNNRDRLTKAISKLAMFSFETTLTKKLIKNFANFFVIEHHCFFFRLGDFALFFYLI